MATALLAYLASRQKLLLWLIWNLSLAMVPLLVSSLIGAVRKKRTAIVAPLIAIWLLFLPNAFYVATDLIHLSRLEFLSVNAVTTTITYYENFNGYVALLVLFAGAMLALIAGVMSVADIHKLMIEQKWTRKARAITLIAIFGLTGYGLYLGRFLRLNSWDILNPMKIFDEVIGSFGPFTLKISALFAIYVAASYIFYKKVLKK